jgi:hypothetical protein
MAEASARRRLGAHARLSDAFVVRVVTGPEADVVLELQGETAMRFLLARERGQS